MANFEESVKRAFREEIQNAVSLAVREEMAPIHAQVILFVEQRNM